jgi:hypothetical protein
MEEFKKVVQKRAESLEDIN